MRGCDSVDDCRYQVIECSSGLPSTGFCYLPVRKINLYPVHGDSGAPIMCTDDSAPTIHSAPMVEPTDFISAASSRAICGVHIGGYDADNSLQVGTRLTPFIQWITETVLLCRLYSVTRPLPPLVMPSEMDVNATSLQGQSLASTDEATVVDIESAALVIPLECQQLFDSVMKTPMVDDLQARLLSACISGSTATQTYNNSPPEPLPSLPTYSNSNFTTTTPSPFPSPAMMLTASSSIP